MAEILSDMGPSLAESLHSFNGRLYVRLLLNVRSVDNTSFDGLIVDNKRQRHTQTCA